MSHPLHRLSTEQLRIPSEPAAGMHPNTQFGLGLALLVVVFLTAGRLPTLLRPPPQPVYVTWPRLQSLYLPGGDGTRLAVDVWLPTRLLKDQKIGTVIRVTRRWRAAVPAETPFQLRQATPEAEAAARQQLALVVVDARGSGASYGSHSGPVDPRDLADLLAIVGWVTVQPWSNGQVATLGTGLDGALAELLAAGGSPAVRAAAIDFCELDLDRHLIAPGGVRNLAYDASRRQLERYYDTGLLAVTADGKQLAPEGAAAARRLRPAPVGNDATGQVVAAAIAEHRASPAAEAPFLAGQLAPPQRLASMARTQPRLCLWGGWHSGATSLGALARYASLRTPVQVLVGPWNQGGTQAVDPLASPPTLDSLVPGDLLQSALWFCRGAVDLEQPREAGRWIRYYVLGAGVWRTSDRWPPIHKPLELYAAAGGRLVRTAPTEQSAADTYRVDPNATTGRANRWWSRSTGQPVRFEDRRAADRKLLCYTTDAFPKGLEFAGSPLLELEFSADVPDVSVFAYLEVVLPDGRVVLVTEGVLRARYRLESPAPAPLEAFGPYHALRDADARLLVPGEPATMRLTLLPTAVAVPPGGRLRLALAGADADTFARVPATGRPTLRIYRDAVRSTRITLPVVR